MLKYITKIIGRLTQMKIPKKLNKIVGKIVNGITNGVSQTSVKGKDAFFPPEDGIGDACRLAAAESIVLLKNNGSVLPLTPDNTVSVFGRVQYDTFFVGYGSGGDVNAHYTVSISDGLKANKSIRINEKLDAVYAEWRKENPVDNGFWGHWPMCYDEMPLSEALVAEAARNSDTAFVVIGRAAGEDRENTLEKGSYYLTDEEERMLSLVTRYFKRTCVILNIGGIFDFSWIEKYNIPCALICWQGGMETGNAVADVVSGDITPSGKLTDSIAREYADYPSAANFGGKKLNKYVEDIFVGYRYFETFCPEKVLFPFGYGLSYTTFDYSEIKLNESGGDFSLSLKVTNTGKLNGKETVQVYCAFNGDKLPNPAMRLVAFAKTREIAPGETQNLTLDFTAYTLASYDDNGVTGHKSAYVLEKGDYDIRIGTDVRHTVSAGVHKEKKLRVCEQLTEVSAVAYENRFMRLRPLYSDGKVSVTFEPSPVRTVDLKEEILDSLPPYIARTDRSITLDDVLNGRATPEDLAGTLSNDELEAITRGAYIMNSPLGAKGNASVFCGVLPSLREKGIPPITCTDGPSGIRLSQSSALLPNGTALASTWNGELVSSLYELLGKEMLARGSDVLLAPGMNIHRNPLCGRNFEYFSEDPLVSGKSAAAVVRGLQRTGVSACPKHFCCNNQETRRTKNDSVLCERALREIYLKGFEICVKEAHPKTIMTSYNKINGVWGHYNYELVTAILRGEWGFDGAVMTDWWMQSSVSPEFPKLKDQAYRVRAGVDVLMPGGARVGKKTPDGTLLASLGREEGITLGEIQAAALRVIRFATKLPYKFVDSNKNSSEQ